MSDEYITASMLPESWRFILNTEFEKPYMKELRAFLRQEKDQKKIIYPKSADVFNAFKYTPYDDVKVVIIGQDPYHGPNQAHGLCFSVQAGVTAPPSLKNIFKEIKQDVGAPIPKMNGCLEVWAKQGVLLLNSVLTVERGLANSHQGKGWERFTDQVIIALNQAKSGLVFLLWGAYAQRKGQMIDANKHCVLKSAHPSPLSSHQGFFGCKHFSKTNQYLVEKGQKPIDWGLDD